MTDNENATQTWSRSSMRRGEARHERPAWVFFERSVLPRLTDLVTHNRQA